jgi:hypothetical protein
VRILLGLSSESGHFSASRSAYNSSACPQRFYKSSNQAIEGFQAADQLVTLAGGFVQVQHSCYQREHYQSGHVWIAQHR